MSILLVEGLVDTRGIRVDNLFTSLVKRKTTRSVDTGGSKSGGRHIVDDTDVGEFRVVSATGRLEGFPRLDGV